LTNLNILVFWYLNIFMKGVSMPSLFGISVAASLALHSTALLAASKAPMQTRELSACLGASEAHLSKVLQRLSRAGLLRAKRGPGGGFSLAKTPAEISLKDIYEAVEGPIAPHFCLFGVHKSSTNDCPLSDEFCRAGSKLLKFMAETKLSDYRKNKCAEVTSNDR
jgi:Rrf2 family protein